MYEVYFYLPLDDANSKRLMQSVIMYSYSLDRPRHEEMPIETQDQRHFRRIDHKGTFRCLQS